MDSIQEMANARRGAAVSALLALMFVAGCGDASREPAARSAATISIASPVPAASAASAPQRFVQGTLGGMKVRIPSHFASLMEFSGEPTDWKRGPLPLSKRPANATRDIASFGFEVRYPDMAGLSTRELRREYDQRPFKVNPWISVTITSGDIYRGQAPAKRAAGKLAPSPFDTGQYAAEPSDVPTLTRYRVQGMNPKTGQPWRLELTNEDVYLARDPQGQVNVLIQCSNTEIGRQACTQVFDLEPDAKVMVSAYFGRDMLPQWQDIQERTRALLLGFRVE